MIEEKERRVSLRFARFDILETDLSYEDFRKIIKGLSRTHSYHLADHLLRFVFTANEQFGLGWNHDELLGIVKAGRAKNKA